MQDITIYTASTKKAVTWNREELDFIELARRLEHPIRSTETHKEYLNLPKDKQDELKDVGGYVGGELKDGIRKKSSVLNRTLIALDADEIDSQEDFKRIIKKLRDENIPYIAHSTRKSTIKKPRLRIIIPLSEPISPEEYEPAVRALCSELGIGHFDRTTVDVNRLMFWPSVSRDQKYIFEANLGAPLFDTRAFIKRFYKGDSTLDKWPKFLDETRVIERLSKKAEDPLTKDNYVGTFCRAYSISEAIETFLSDVYRKESDERYTYLAGSSTGGALVYDDKWLYSYHNTDPACEKECNSYDLVRIHLFGNTKKSDKEMVEFIQKDEGYRQQELDEALEAFEGIELDDDEGRESYLDEYKKIYEKLEKQKKKVLATSENFCIILANDPRLKDRFHYDIFADRRIVSGKLPWHNEMDRLPRSWNDTDEACLRVYIQKYFSITGGKENLDDAIKVTFNLKHVHPIREYLEALPPWDGVKRAERLLIDYFGAEDNVYTREVIKKTLLAAVIRVYEPGAKFDNIPVLIGKQGIGKSTFVHNLTPVPEWYVDTDPRFNGREAYEVLQNKWIIEIGELKSLSRKEAEQTKQYISKQSDYYRLPYAKNPEEHPRQCIFIATTNNQTFLNDITGNRRFWPIQLGVHAVYKDIWERLPLERDQIWAEVLEAYNSGESVLLTKEASVYAELEQNNRMEDDPRIGEIIEFIKSDIPTDWEKRNKEARLNYWINDQERYDGPVKKRDRICAREIMAECYNISDIYVKRTAKEINSILDTIPGLEKAKSTLSFGKVYGKQKGYRINKEFYELNS